jgi:hypothetical protein
LWVAFLDLELDTITFMQGQDPADEPVDWAWYYFEPDPDITDHRQMSDIATMYKDDRTVCAWSMIEDIDWSGQGYEFWPGQATIEHNGDPSTWTYTWDPYPYRNCSYPSIGASNTFFYFAFAYPDELNGTSRVNVRWGDATVESDMELWKNIWGMFDTNHEYNATKPTMAGSSTNAVLVYQSDENGNQDLMCTYTTDDAETWQSSTVVDDPEDEENPRVYVVDNSVYLIYMKGGDLYYISSNDVGATWDTPMKLNDVDDVVVTDWRMAELYKNYFVWTDLRNANQDIYFDAFIFEPDKPDTPDGPAEVKVNEEATYTTSTTDPQDDDVYYMWDWGDGSELVWDGPYSSGDEVTGSHTWDEKGNYEIRVKAKDTGDHESEWSDKLPIQVPRSKDTSNLLFSDFLRSLLDRLFDLGIFPLLQSLLD